MEAEEEYFIATSANKQALEETSKLKRVTRDEIDRIVDSKSQNLIFMIKGTQANVLQKIPEIFKNFVTVRKDNPGSMLSKTLYSGGIASAIRFDEQHSKLAAGELVKRFCGDAIKNVYAPPVGNGYNIGPNQARVFYEINDLNHFQEFWHTEPAAIEQFLVWKNEGNEISNVIMVSEESMCQFCSRFLLHSFCTEAIAQKNVRFVVISLSLLDNIQSYNSIDRSKKVKFSDESLALQNQLLSGISEDSKMTMVEGIKKDFKKIISDGNKLAIYCF